MENKQWLLMADGRPDWGDIAKRVALLMPDGNEIIGKLELEDYDDGNGAPVFCVTTDDGLEVSLEGAEGWRHIQETKSEQPANPLDSLKDVASLLQVLKSDSDFEKRMRGHSEQETGPECSPPFLLWSTNKPTMPGWYWCRKTLLPPTLVKVSEPEVQAGLSGLVFQCIGTTIVTSVESMTDCEWYGPVEPPEG